MNIKRHRPSLAGYDPTVWLVFKIEDSTEDERERISDLLYPPDGIRQTVAFYSRETAQRDFYDLVWLKADSPQLAMFLVGWSDRIDGPWNQLPVAAKIKF